jgi:predicted TIM-barrel fold metal-dependent hydrolase
LDTGILAYDYRRAAFLNPEIVFFIRGKWIGSVCFSVGTPHVVPMDGLDDHTRKFANSPVIRAITSTFDNSPTGGEMQQHEVYIGFPPLPDKHAIVEALLNDPPEVRWRMIRQLFKIRDSEDRQALIETLQPHLKEAESWRLRYRLHLGLQALHRPLNISDYRLVKGKGACKESEIDRLHEEQACPFEQPLFPIVDFHIHPKMPDLKFFTDMREAGITHGVILATDTDPEDVERPEIREQLKTAFDRSHSSGRMDFESLLRHIKKSLYSPTHVTNQDVADWVQDYPEMLTGFGSVDLCKDKPYVLKTLDEIARLKLRGLKFLPHSQFFNPAENEHMATVFEYCMQTGSIILSHSGCGPGPFEIIELSHNSHPALWQPWLKKYPQVPLVLAHAGAYSTEIPGIWLFDALQLGKTHSNVYIDLAAVDWLLDREMVIQEIRKTIGFDRVLFATDYPLPLSAGVSWAYIVKRVQTNTYLTPKEKHKILGKNAAGLLGL